MTRRIWLTLMVMCALMGSALPARAASVEVRIGTEPSVSVLADWDLTSRLSFAASVGLVLGDGTQTPSATVQTPSVTFKASLSVRYALADPESAVVPYVALGADVRVRGARLTVMAHASTGLRVRLVRGLYVLGEGSGSIPIAGPGRTRLELIIGLRYRF